MDKKRLRKTMNNVLASCSDRQVVQWSEAVTTNIVSLNFYRSARVIMTFLSMAGEYDTSLLIAQALADGKTVVVPRVNFTDKSMAAVKLSSLKQEMVIDRYGLRNPADNIEVDLSEIDLIIVPGLAFDTNGHRLGRGGGFYDRFLSREQVSNAVRCAVAFELQIVDNIPTDEHDVLIPLLVTEKRVIEFSR